MSSRLIVLLLIGLVASACDRQKADAPQAPVADAAADAASGKGVDRSHKGEAIPSVTFRNPDDQHFFLTAGERGPILLNLWASWCAPCVKELPTLHKLEQAKPANAKLIVIAVSQDTAPKASVDAFLKEKGIGQFAAYRDPDMKLTSALGVQIMPTTILYDSAGKEVWRFVGDLDWSGAEAAKLLAEAS